VPLVALLHGERIDSTIVARDGWDLYRAEKPQQDFRCRECAAPMHTKRSKLETPFFAHNKGTTTECSARGESKEHQYLKHLVASMVRQAPGWEPTVEAYPDDNDTRDWRADVLAIGPGSRRIAFEVQLAGMTAEEGQRRTARYAEDGIETVWVAAKGSSWLWRLPGFRVDLTDVGPEAANPLLRVIEGLGAWDSPHGDAWCRWRGTQADVGDVVGGILSGRVVSVDVPYVLYEVNHGGQLRTRSCTSATVLTTRRHIEPFEAWAREQERERQRRAQFEANARAIDERRARLLPRAFAAATLALQPSSSAMIWLGVPPTAVTHPSHVDVANARGNDKTGYGLAIWVGDRSGRELCAVVAPTAGRLTEGLGASWARRRVSVWVESQQEAAAITRALGWRLNNPLIHLVEQAPVTS
jgi:hypothetical protein